MPSPKQIHERLLKRKANGTLSRKKVKVLPAKLQREKNLDELIQAATILAKQQSQMLEFIATLLTKMEPALLRELEKFNPKS